MSKKLVKVQIKFGKDKPIEMDMPGTMVSDIPFIFNNFKDGSGGLHQPNNVVGKTLKSEFITKRKKACVDSVTVHPTHSTVMIRLDSIKDLEELLAHAKKRVKEVGKIVPKGPVLVHFTPDITIVLGKI